MNDSNQNDDDTLISMLVKHKYDSIISYYNLNKE